MNVPFVTDAYGSRFPSVLWSYFFWKEKGIIVNRNLVVPKNAIGQCAKCEDFKVISEDQQYVRCYCYLKDYLVFVESSLEPYASTIPKATLNLDDFQEHGTAEGRRSLRDLKNTATSFVESPEKWALVVGVPGSGKSHIMGWIKRILGPLALYLTDADFESAVFETTKTHDLDDFLSMVKRVPVLLYDDIGTAHASDYVTRQLFKVIDFRYRHASEFPVWASTNLNHKELYAWNARLADRLVDNDNVDLIPLFGVSSWRVRYASP